MRQNRPVKLRLKQRQRSGQSAFSCPSRPPSSYPWFRLAARHLRGGEQLREVLLPKGGPSVRSMSMGLIGCRQQREVPVLHAFDFTFGDTQLRRVDEIISRV